MRLLYLYLMLACAVMLTTSRAAADTPDGLRVVIEARVADPGQRAPIIVNVNGQEVHRFSVDQNWRSYSFVLPPEMYQISALMLMREPGPVMEAGSDCEVTGPCTPRHADILVRDVRIGGISGGRQLADGSIDIRTITHETLRLVTFHPEWTRLAESVAPDFMIALAGMQLEGAPMIRLWLNNRAFDTREIRNERWAPIRFTRPQSVEDVLCVEIELLNFAEKQNSREARDIIIGGLRINADSRDDVVDGRWVTDSDHIARSAYADGLQPGQRPSRNPNLDTRTSGSRLGTASLVWNIAESRISEPCVQLAAARRRSAGPRTRTLIPADSPADPASPRGDSVLFDPEAPIPGTSSAEEVSRYCNAKRSELLRLQARIPQISAQILVARSCCGDPPYIDDLTVDGLNYEAGRVQAERQRIVAMTDEDIFDGILAEMADDLERMDPADASIDVWADDEGDIETGLPAVFEGNEIEGFLANPPSADELQPDDAAADPEGVDPGVVAQERARQRARRINGRREDLLQANSALSLRIDQELGARADYDRLEPELQEVMRGAVESGRLIEMHCPR